MTKNTKILIINSGSSSIKYQLIEMPSEHLLCKGLVERIGEHDALLKYESGSVSYEIKESITAHKSALQKIIEILLDPEKGVIKNSDDIEIVGHRVVHGGNSFSKTTRITDEVKEKIREHAVLAPLHNPHNLEGILLAEEFFTRAQQVAVFDTAFHQTIPLKTKKYAIPNEFFDKHKIQLYGFHGTSHKYVSEQAKVHLNPTDSKLISIHLGNGCSITAIHNGKSLDHSLGFAPSNGLIMGSRSGDIDHAIIFYLVNNLGYNLEEVNQMLIKESGMLGLTGYNDLRDIEAQAEKGNKKCILALEMNAYRIKKYIGAYAAAMNGVDAVIFTAGIGENSSTLRALICRDMDYLGIHLDTKTNAYKSNEMRAIHKEASQVKLLVIPTNEELEIAKQTFHLLN